MTLKKRILALFLAFNLIAAGGLSVSAQEEAPGEVFDFERAYQDFVFSFDEYRVAHSSYELARAQYLQSETLTSRSNAQAATSKMLQARDQVTMTHLTALRLRLAEAQGIANDRRETLYQRIDIEVEWYNTHKGDASSAATLEDLVQDSKEAKDRYDITTLPLIYEVLSEVALGKYYTFRGQSESIIDQIEQKLIEIRLNNDLDVSPIERWLLETQNRIARGNEKEAEVQKLKTDLIRQRGSGALNSYNQIVFRVRESIQYLKDADNFFFEILRKIKLA